MSVALRATIAECRYPQAPAPALRDIELTVARGEFVLVVGPAGSGKTTLCYCLAGVIPKVVRARLDGMVELDGRDIASLPLPSISPLLGLVLQTPENQLFNVTVREDVAFGPENLLLSPSEVEQRVRDSMAFAGVTHLADRFSHLLSGGESQRVVLASVLALGAGLFVFDQPAAELDPAGRRKIYEQIGRLSRESGKTVILVEDRIGEVAAYADRVLLLHEGRVVRDLPPRRFFSGADLHAYGVRLPDGVALYRRLAELGVKHDTVPLTVSEAVDGLRGLVDGAPPGARDAVVSAPSSATGGASGRLLAPAVFETRGLAYRYPGGIDALRGVDLLVHTGEFVALLGENGAGKTTLARHLVGLLRPTRGTVRVMGHDIAGMPVHLISRWVGFLFQDPDWQIFNNTCLDEVAYGLRLRRTDPERAAQTAWAALERVGLAEVADAHPYTLSRGQRQRLAVASVLALRPPALVVDEPTTGLDYRESVAMMDVLEEYRRDGGTVLVITHDVDLATRFARRIVVMAGGRIVYDAPADRLQADAAALDDAAVVLPDLARIVRALGLPSALRGVDDVARALAALWTGRTEGG